MSSDIGVHRSGSRQDIAPAGPELALAGPRIEVQDYYGNQELANTEDLLSTSGWRELVEDFAAGPQTRLIAIKVMRVAGNPLIKGTFWLDDVKLTPVAPVEVDTSLLPTLNS